MKWLKDLFKKKKTYIRNVYNFDPDLEEDYITNNKQQFIKLLLTHDQKNRINRIIDIAEEAIYHMTDETVKHARAEIKEIYREVANKHNLEI